MAKYSAVSLAEPTFAGVKTKNYKLRRRLVHGLIYIFCFAVALTALYPFFVMLVGSTHDSYTVTTQLTLLPGKYLAANYERLTRTMNIWRGFANSFGLALVSTVCTIYLSALTAYGFAKFKFRGKGALCRFWWPEPAAYLR